jgi:hypothetical protein
MITYDIEKTTMTDTPGTCHAVVIQQESAGGDAFIKLAAETLNMSEGQAIGVINGLSHTAKTLIGQGWGFTLPGFGHFSFSIRGVFPGPDAPYDPAVQKVSVNFRVDAALTAAAQTAPKTRIHGVEHGPVIDAVINMAAAESNTSLTPGGNTKVSGKNIKITGPAPTVGIAIIDEDGAAVTVDTAAISHNGPTELIFICPALPPGVYHLRVTTQFCGTSGHYIDPPRSYTFAAPLTVT